MMRYRPSAQAEQLTLPGAAGHVGCGVQLVALLVTFASFCFWVAQRFTAAITGLFQTRLQSLRWRRSPGAECVGRLENRGTSRLSRISPRSGIRKLSPVSFTCLALPPLRVSIHRLKSWRCPQLQSDYHQGRDKCKFPGKAPPPAAYHVIERV